MAALAGAFVAGPLLEAVAEDAAVRVTGRPLMDLTALDSLAAAGIVLLVVALNGRRLLRWFRRSKGVA